MTIKDIEKMRNRLRGNIDFYIEVEEPEGTNLIYFKSFDNLIKFVKENYTDNLISKENSEKKIIGVKIWRKD